MCVHIYIHIHVGEENLRRGIRPDDEDGLRQRARGGLLHQEGDCLYRNINDNKDNHNTTTTTNDNSNNNNDNSNNAHTNDTFVLFVLLSSLLHQQGEQAL